MRTAGNYAKAALGLGIAKGRAARIKQAPTLEEALQIAGTPEIEPTQQPPPGGNGASGKPATPSTRAPSRKPEDTRSLTEASVVTFVPREMKVNSVLLLVAKRATEQEWGWPEMEVGKWLDNFLYHALRQRGIVIGSYIRVGKEHGV